MLTKEFIKEVEKLGFKILKNKEYILIHYGFEKVAYVYKNDIFSLGTGYIPFYNLSKELQEKLYNLMDEYARTPIDEREEQQKFYLKHKWLRRSKDIGYYLNLYLDEDYFLGNFAEKGSYKTQFTQAEIYKIKERFNTNLEDFEQVHVKDKEIE